VKLQVLSRQVVFTVAELVEQGRRLDWFGGRQRARIKAPQVLGCTVEVQVLIVEDQVRAEGLDHLALLDAAREEAVADADAPSGAAY
jgi:hypothetical protein